MKLLVEYISVTAANHDSIVPALRHKGSGKIAKGHRGDSHADIALRQSQSNKRHWDRGFMVGKDFHKFGYTPDDVGADSTDLMTDFQRTKWRQDRYKQSMDWDMGKLGESKVITIHHHPDYDEYRVPSGSKKIGAGYFTNDKKDAEDTARSIHGKDIIIKHSSKRYDTTKESTIKSFRKWMQEDAVPANAVGGGAIAGTGIGIGSGAGQAEPGVHMKRKKRVVLNFFTRKKFHGSAPKK